jgi:hypothetical protein
MRHTVSQVKSQSNTLNDTYDFKIGDAAVVIDILRNKLYSDKIRVVTQEYLCNARDAMRECGNTTDKIEVTLPTKKNPVFKIRDYGPGLSEERVQEVFVQFGRSTKRETDVQTGGFGLGGKSAFCYTESFLVVSIHGGLETHYVAHLGRNAVGTLEKVFQGPTSAKAGVEIQIGVNLSSELFDEDSLDDLTRFHHGVYRTIAFWSPTEQPVIKNPSDAVQSGFVTLSEIVSQRSGVFCDNLIVIQKGDRKGYISASLAFVVDGIIYDDNGDFDSAEREKLMSTLEYGAGAFLIVKSSDVEVAASREALAVNQKNAQVFKLAYRQARAQLMREIADTIAKVEKINQIQGALKHLSPLCSSVRGATKVVEGVLIDFQEGTLSTKDGYQSFDISGRRGGVRINDYVKPRLDGFFLYNDADLAVTTLKNKVKGLYQADNSKKHFVVVPKNMTTAAVLFSATPVSSLRSPRVSRAGFTRQQVPTGYVAVKTIANEYRGNKVTNTTIDLSGVPVDLTYVVVPEVTEKAKMLTFGPIQELLREAGAKVSFCFPTKTSLKQIDGHSSFVNKDIFFGDLTLWVGKRTMKKVRSIIETTLLEIGLDTLPLAIEVLTPLITCIDDPVIADGLTRLSTAQNNKSTTSVAESVISDAIVIEVFKSDFGSLNNLSLFTEQLKGNYGFLVGAHLQDPMTFVYYINGKYSFSMKTAA